MRKTVLILAVLAAVVATPAHAGRKDGGWGWHLVWSLFQGR